MSQRDNCPWELSCTLSNVEQNLWPLPLDAKSAHTKTPILSDKLLCFQTFPNIPWDGREPPIENTVLKLIF